MSGRMDETSVLPFLHSLLSVAPRPATVRTQFMTARFLRLLACSALLLTGCDTGSNSSSGSVVNYAGTYSNGGKPMAYQHTGAAVTSMDVIQEGDKLLATDNNGINFRGSISGEGSDGLSPFSINGKTTDGAAVSIVGAFSRDSSRATMNGNWIEPSVESTFVGFSGDAPAPASTTTPAPAANPTPAPATPDAMPDPVNLSQADWRRGDYGKNASREVVLQSVNLQHTKISLQTMGPITWDNIGSSSDIEGDLCLFKNMGSQLVGGSIDSVKRGQTSKGLDNVLPPSGNILGSDWHMQPGETIYICLIGYRNGNPVRSNVLQAQYPP